MCVCVYVPANVRVCERVLVCVRLCVFLQFLHMCFCLCISPLQLGIAGIRDLLVTVVLWDGTTSLRPEPASLPICTVTIASFMPFLLLLGDGLGSGHGLVANFTQTLGGGGSEAPKKFLCTYNRPPIAGPFDKCHFFLMWGGVRRSSLGCHPHPPLRNAKPWLRWGANLPLRVWAWTWAEAP